MARKFWQTPASTPLSDEAQMRESRHCKNQKAQFLKSEKSGFLNFKFFNPGRLR
jgi:hypothetical protein